MDPSSYKGLRQTLLEKRPLYGLYVSLACPDLTELVANDWDWLWIDQQHSPIDQIAALALVRVAERAGVFSVIRVAANDQTAIGSALDLGASGVIVPLVNTAEDARRAVVAARFPPVGRRSVGSRRLMSGYGRDFWASHGEAAAMVVQIESREAVANSEAIAAVLGVDGVLLGTDDLAAEAGVALQFPADRAFRDNALARVIEGAGRSGKAVGCFCDDDEAVRTAVAMGASFLVCAEDWLLLQQSSRRAADCSRRAGASS